MSFRNHKPRPHWHNSGEGDCSHSDCYITPWDAKYRPITNDPAYDEYIEQLARSAKDSGAVLRAAGIVKPVKDSDKWEW